MKLRSGHNVGHIM